MGWYTFMVIYNRLCKFQIYILILEANNQTQWNTKKISIASPCSSVTGIDCISLFSLSALLVSLCSLSYLPSSFVEGVILSVFFSGKEPEVTLKNFKKLYWDLFPRKRHHHSICERALDAAWQGPSGPFLNTIQTGGRGGRLTPPKA